MNKDREVVDLRDKRLVETVDIVVVPRQQEMRRVLYLEHLLKLPFPVLDLGFVVDLDRTNVVELDREAKGSEQADWRGG